MYENRIFKRDAYIEISLLYPRHRFAKTRTRRGVGFTFGIKVSVGIDFEKMKKSFNHF
jgi:hypothetical protein